MAASLGHMSWWPGAGLAAVYALSLLRLKPRAPADEPRETEFKIDEAGVTSHDQAGVTHLSWSEVTQVDLVSADVELAGEPLFFVIVGKDRKLVMPGSQAVLGRLVNAMTTQLGLLDEAKFLRALGSRGEARFTIWQR